jgi:DNA/RNA endonuclease YhcR with UshA esterase domain
MRNHVLVQFVVLLASLGAESGWQDVKPLSPAEATKKINEKCTVEMKVASTGKGGKVYFLNSNENFRDETNFTVFIKAEAVESFKNAKIDDIAAHYKGKTILVTGTVSLFKERPQIAVENAEQVRIVDKTKN